MSPLTGLWLVSLVLSGVALLIMVALIVARVINRRRQKTREAERRRLVPLLLDTEPRDDLPEKAERAPDLLADLSTELVQMVRGTDKENFVASSTRLGVPERLRHRLDTGSPRTRLAAAEALADFGDEDSVERLREALDDPNSDVRLSAALGLAAAGEAPPVRLLVERLGIGTRENSLLIVGLFRDIATERPEEIKNLIEDDQMPAAVKVAAIDALSVSGDYSLVPLIVDLAIKSDPNGEELPRYLRALGDFGHPAGAPAVEYALDSEAWWARAAAAQAAGRIGLNASAERLAELLDDPQWWVRFRAGEALVALGEDGHRLLREVGNRGTDLARHAATLTMAEQGVRQ